MSVYHEGMSMSDKLKQLVTDGIVETIVLRGTEDDDELVITFNNGVSLLVQARLSRYGDAAMYIDGHKYPGDIIHIYTNRKIDPLDMQGKFVINEK